MENQIQYQEIQNQEYELYDHQFFRNNPNCFIQKSEQIEAEIRNNLQQLDNPQQLDGNQEFNLNTQSKQLTDSLKDPKNPFLLFIQTLNRHVLEEEQSIWFSIKRFFCPSKTICLFETVSEVDKEQKESYLVLMLKEYTKCVDNFRSIFQVFCKLLNHGIQENKKLNDQLVLTNDQLVQKEDEIQKLNQQQKELTIISQKQIQEIENYKVKSEKLQQVFEEQMELLNNQSQNQITNQKKLLDFQSQVNQLNYDKDSLQNELTYLEQQNILKEEKYRKSIKSSQICETEKNEKIKKLEQNIKDLLNQKNEFEQRISAMQQDKNDLENQIQCLQQVIKNNEKLLQKYNEETATEVRATCEIQSNENENEQVEIKQQDD